MKTFMFSIMAFSIVVAYSLPAQAQLQNSRIAIPLGLQQHALWAPGWGSGSGYGFGTGLGFTTGLGFNATTFGTGYGFPTTLPYLASGGFGGYSGYSGFGGFGGFTPITRPFLPGAGGMIGGFPQLAGFNSGFGFGAPITRPFLPGGSFGTGAGLNSGMWGGLFGGSQIGGVGSIGGYAPPAVIPAAMPVRPRPPPVIIPPQGQGQGQQNPFGSFMPIAQSMIPQLGGFPNLTRQQIPQVQMGQSFGNYTVNAAGNYGGAQCFRLIAPGPIQKILCLTPNGWQVAPPGINMMITRRAPRIIPVGRMVPVVAGPAAVGPMGVGRAPPVVPMVVH